MEPNNFILSPLLSHFLLFTPVLSEENIGKEMSEISAGKDRRVVGK